MLLAGAAASEELVVRLQEEKTSGAARAMQITGTAFFKIRTSFRVCNTVEGETLPLCWDKYYKKVISRCKSSINGILLIFVVG